jgi:hypothetical protein
LSPQEGHHTLRRAIIVQDASSRETLYFVLLAWADGQVGDITDFCYARHAMEGAALLVAK